MKLLSLEHCSLYASYATSCTMSAFRAMEQPSHSPILVPAEYASRYLATSVFGRILKIWNLHIPIKIWHQLWWYNFAAMWINNAYRLWWWFWYSSDPVFVSHVQTLISRIHGTHGLMTRKEQSVAMSVWQTSEQHVTWPRACNICTWYQRHASPLLRHWWVSNVMQQPLFPSRITLSLESASQELRLPADHEDLSLLSDLTHVSSSFPSSPLSPSFHARLKTRLFHKSSIVLLFHPPDWLHGL